MIPKWKVEVWQGGNLLYSLTDQVSTIKIREVLTDEIGTFEFSVPTKIGTDYIYHDINVGDMIKIWLGYADSDGLPTDPISVGKIFRINAPLNVKSGFIRVFAGRNLGEVLDRRIKGRKAWVNTAADLIVDEIADDLELGVGQIADDNTGVNLTVDAETYFDVLRKVSDYWTATAIVKKDFYVDVNNNLVWKARPIRDTDEGVESLEVDKNIVNYSVLHDSTQLKNKIYVYGEKAAFNPKDPTVLGRKNPVGGDEWTHSSGWTPLLGTVGSNTTTPKVGSDNTRAILDDNGDFQCFRTFSQIWVEGLAGYSTVEAWFRADAVAAGLHPYMRLRCPDASNYYELDLYPEGTGVDWANWLFRRKAIGEHNTYDAIINPEGEWTKHSNPTWENIQGIEFYLNGPTEYAGRYFDVDGLCFNFGKWRNSAESDPTAYGLRELVVVDDQLKSDLDCQRRAESLLYQKNAVVKRLDVTVVGNINVKIGDRIPMTIPAENINSVNFDVVAVEHYLDTSQGFLTKAVMVDTPNTRSIPAASPNEILKHQFNKVKDYARGLQAVAR